MIRERCGFPYGSRFDFTPQEQVPRQTVLCSWISRLDNEQATLRRVVERVMSVGLELELLCVSDFVAMFFAVIETENLFINVARKMKRLDTNVGSLEAALQK